MTPVPFPDELTPDERLRLLHLLKLTRACDEAIVRLYRQGKILGGAYTGTGNEATAVGSAFALAPHDYLFPMHRDLGAHLAKGQSLAALFLQVFGRKESRTRGKDGTGHYADPALRIYGNVSHLAAMIPVAAGVALACRLRKEQAVVLTYIGDGGSNVGDFHEGLNLAAVMRLPLILIIENNQYAYSTPTAMQSAAARLSDRAAGYGIPGVTIDGTDVAEVVYTVRQAVDRARGGGGPTLIESVTMRLQGHSAADDASYVPPVLLEEWRRKDPVRLWEDRLAAAGELDPQRLADMTAEITRAVTEAARDAEAAPLPEAADAGTDVYAEM